MTENDWAYRGTITRSNGFGFLPTIVIFWCHLHMITRREFGIAAICSPQKFFRTIENSFTESTSAVYYQIRLPTVLGIEPFLYILTQSSPYFEISSIPLAEQNFKDCKYWLLLFSFFLCLYGCSY